MEKTLITQQIINLDRLEENTGQLPGLPSNPRYITDDKLAKLKDNIVKYPQLLEWRSLLVYPLASGNYIIIGGNQRFRAMRELGHTEAPCIVISANTTVERLKAMTVLDNASFGKFDMDALANMWDDAQLDSFGVDIPTFQDEPLDGLFEQKPKSNDGAPTPDTIIITLPEALDDEADTIIEFLSDVLTDRFNGCKVSLKE